MQPLSGRWWTKLLRWPRRVDRRLPEAVCHSLPELSGAPIRIEFLPALTSRNRKLESGSGKGTPVHAASYLRQRRMVLESSLLKKPAELRRILIHELFHYVWLRAGNRKRMSFEKLLAGEFHRGAPGELGWSAELRKQCLSAADRRARTRRWREYVCESFCDTAAWLYGGLGQHDEFTLPARCREERREWFGIFSQARIIHL